MKIAIPTDHGGYNLKQALYEYLKEKYEIIDLSTNSTQSCDYPVFAKKVVDEILNKNCERGILVCGTGVGMAITANRYKGIRASNISDTFLLVSSIKIKQSLY